MNDASDQLSRLLEEASALEGEARERYLDRECGDDSALRNAVNRMLRADSQAESFFASLDKRIADDCSDLLDDTWSRDRLLGAYRLVKQIGSGGMGTVYLAERADGTFERQVALKVIPLGLDDKLARQRFDSERAILASLKHPNIAQLLDAGVTEDGRPYLVMDYVDGESITDFCQRARPARRALIRLFLQVVDAVQYAHENLVIHRDLKPNNVLVTSAGEVRLLDFGIAKLLDDDAELTRSGVRPLTPKYSAPEQRDAGVISTRTDVYQLGLMLYLLATGEHFDGAAQVPGDLGAVLNTALHEDAGQRYPTALQFGQDLRSILDGHPVKAKPDTLSYRARRFAGRHPFGITASTLMAVTIIGFSLLTWRQSERVAQERDAATRVTEMLVSVFEGADPTRTRETLSARELLDAGAERVLNGLQEDDPTRPDLVTALGRAYHNLGEFDAAKALYDGALSAPLDEERRARLVVLRGEIARAQGDYPGAETWLRQALEITAASEGTNSVQYAELSIRLGRVLTLQRSWDESREMLESGLATLESRSADGARLAHALDSLGSLEFAQGNFQQVEALLTQALEIRRQPGFVDQPALGTNLNNLGLAFSAQGKVDQAEPLIRESIAIRRDVLPPGHPEYAQSLGNLAVVLESRPGGAGESKQLLTEALEIRRATLPAGHPTIAQTINNLGMAEFRLGNSADAVPLFDEARELMSQQLGPSHPAIASMLSNKGAALLALDKVDDAFNAYTESLLMREATLPAEHPHVAYSLVGLARIQLRRSQPEAARLNIERGLRIRSATLPSDHWLIAEFRWLEGMLATVSGDIDRGRQLIESSYITISRARGENDPLTLAVAETLQS